MSDLEREVQILKRRVEELWAKVVGAGVAQAASAPLQWFWSTETYDTGTTTLPSSPPTSADFGIASSLERGSAPAERLAMTMWVSCPSSGNVVGFRGVLRCKNGGEALRVPFTLASSSLAGTTGRIGLRVNDVLQQDGYVTIPQGVSEIGVYAYLKTAPGHTVSLLVDLPQGALLEYEPQVSR